jgi:hypothetical protein
MQNQCVGRLPLGPHVLLAELGQEGELHEPVSRVGRQVGRQLGRLGGREGTA